MDGPPPTPLATGMPPKVGALVARHPTLLPPAARHSTPPDAVAAHPIEAGLIEPGPISRRLATCHGRPSSLDPVSTFPLLPTLATVRLILPPALVFIVACLDRGYQTELWQHLARGRLVARHHAVVSTDVFTFTVPGRFFRDNNWLSQLLYHGLHSAGGIELLQFTNALALAAAVTLLVRLCLRESNSSRVAGAIGTAAFLGLWQTLLVRPQSFSMLLFVALYALLRAAASGRTSLLALVPPLMGLWANVHGGFAVGLLLVSTFAASVVWRRLHRVAAPCTPTDPSAPPSPSASPLPWLAALLGGALATLLNPYGVSVYRYAGELSALGVARGIEEWLPPSPDSLVGGCFFLSVAAVAALLVRARRRVTFQDVLTLACFAAPAFVSVRMTVWWVLAAAPVAARLAAAGRGCAPDRSGVTPSSRDEQPRPSWRAAVATAGIVAVCVGSLPWLEQSSPLLGALRPAHRTESDLCALARSLTESAPTAAIPASESAPPSAPGPRVFARMEWSNYLAWQTDGRVKVFAEGHVELYPPQTWAEYLTVNDARPGWDKVLDRYAVRFLLLDQTYHSALLSEVRRSRDWSRLAHSGDAVLFERRGSDVPERSPAVAGASPAEGAGGDF